MALNLRLQVRGRCRLGAPASPLSPRRADPGTVGEGCREGLQCCTANRRSSGAPRFITRAARRTVVQGWEGI